MDRSKILLVEDHPISRRLLDAMLRQTYQVVQSASGREALEVAEKEKPDLVLLDVELPDMDGFQTLEALKSGPLAEGVPVLFITAREDAASRERGLAAGAVDYLTKPYDRHELIFKLKNHLELFQARKRIERTNRIMAQEMEMASQLQRKLLPESFPNSDKVRFLVDYRPSSRAGGDFYDVIEMPEDQIGFAQVDVAGHGVHSAMIGAMFKMVFHTLVRDTWNPSSLLATINDEMVRVLPISDFLTVFYGVINLRTMELSYSNAGHPRPFLYKQNIGETIELQTGGLLLGAYAGMQYEQGEVHLESGDRILVFTDGVTEAFRINDPEDLYGKERVREALTHSMDQNPASAMEHITEELLAFRNATSFEDDVSLMLIAIQ